jgi:AraC family transcriptional regulator, melibiose operon regulatory protein
MGSALEVFSDLSERLGYNLPDFPLYVRKGDLKLFDRYAAACHWHPDLEFIFVTDGVMECFVNGITVSIDQGNGIFVNSKRLHYGYSSYRVDCSFLVVAVHPSLLGEGMVPCKAYLESKFGANADDYIVLTAQNAWQQEALHCMSLIFDEMNGACNPLQLLSLAVSLCASMGAHIQQGSGHLADLSSSVAVWNMLGYIQRHYDQKITLDDIAAAGSVCRSRCCELFARFVGQAPNSYLMRYRIHKGCEMLRETNRSVCEIAIACGFQSPSYFTYTFRKETGSVPKEYRRQLST